MTAKGKGLWVTGGYGVKGRAPFVAVTMPGGESVQMDIPTARQHALTILKACEGAVQDGFLIEWASGSVPGLDERGAAVLVGELRKWREEKAL